jgi:hypothetical protein
MIGVREMDIDFYRYYARTVEAARGPVWRYDERKCCGVKFSSFFVASRYDRYHEAFRDYRREAEQIVATLGLGNSATVLDIGCGTGASVLALHHLPDFWKLVGLHRLASMSRPDGRLYLLDVVFSFAIGGYEHGVERFLDKMSDPTGPARRGAALTHVRDEYSTCGWIMEGLLERAGFQIDEADYKDDFLAAYVCTRKAVTTPTESLTVVGQQLR